MRHCPAELKDEKLASRIQNPDAEVGAWEVVGVGAER